MTKRSEPKVSEIKVLGKTTATKTGRQTKPTSCVFLAVTKCYSEEDDEEIYSISQVDALEPLIYHNKRALCVHDSRFYFGLFGEGRHNCFKEEHHVLLETFNYLSLSNLQNIL